MNEMADTIDLEPALIPHARKGWHYRTGTFAGPGQRATPGPREANGPPVAELDVLVATDLTITGYFSWVDARLATGPEDPRLDMVIERILDRRDRDDLAENLLECEIYDPYLEKGTDGDDEMGFFTSFDPAELKARLASDQDRVFVTREELFALLEDEEDDLDDGPVHGSNQPHTSETPTTHLVAGTCR